MRRSPDDLNDVFSAVRHTYRAHAEAPGGCAKWNTLLRAIKDADPVRLLLQDLLGG